MKRVLCILVMGLAVMAVSQANVVNNPSFETGDTSSWWTWSETGSATASVTIDGTMASDGTYSLLATTAGDNWAEEAQFGQQFTFDASVAGDELTLMFDYYATGGGFMGINFDYYNPSKHWLGWIDFTAVADEWTTYEVTYALPVGTTAIDLKFIVTGASEINFDNFNATVPEPATMLLLGLGAVTVLRRKRK